MTATMLQRAAVAALLLVSASSNITMAAEIGPVQVTREDGRVQLTQNGPMIEIAAQFATLNDPEPTSAAKPSAAVEAANHFVEQQALIQRELFEPDDDRLVRGTAPEPENYQVLLPIAEGLEVVFGQYQIGPYAIGISRVLLPYFRLTALLNPDLFPNQEQ